MVWWVFVRRESGRYSKIVLTVPLILYWIIKLKTGEIGSGRLSKSASWLWPAFKIRELAMASFQNRRVGSGWLSKSASWLWLVFKIGELALTGFQKLLAQLWEICYPLGAKDMNSPVLKSFTVRKFKSFKRTVFDEMVSRNVLRNAFCCFVKQKGSFCLFRCFTKLAVSAKRVSRNTETVILFREKLNKKRCEVNQSFPILLLFREIFSFSLFCETFR